MLTKSLIALGLVMLSSSAHANCWDDGSTALGSYSSLNRNTTYTKIVICERANGSKYVEYTSPGYPGAITHSEAVVFENKITSIWGPLTQFVTLRSTGLLSQEDVHVLALNASTNTLQLVEAIGAEPNRNQVYQLSHELQ